MDLRLPLNWQDGIWVRGVIAEPNTAEILQDLFQLAIWLLPLSILVSALGAYLLSKKALQPINKLIQTAEKIEEGRDLSCCGELPQGTDEIGRLGHAFSNMLERLERSFEIEKQFTSDASHELRTPITVILTQCDEMLHTDGVGERYQEGVSVIQRQARRMNHMVNQLLQMTRLEQRTQQICMETANMSSLVEVLCEEQLLERGIMITTDIQSDIEAECDVTLMSRLLQNLLSNAIRYGRENGHVWVTLRENEGQVVLSVRDDGIGIPMDKLDQIWNRFYQGDSSRSKQGAGLGLAMVKQIAELHHGTVSADSIENAGSSFTVRFPAHQTADTKEK